MGSAIRRETSPLRANAEIAAVILSGALHLAPLELLFPHIYFIVGVSLAWVVYVGFRVARDPSTGSGQASQRARWGFGGRGFWPSMMAAGLFALAAVGGLAAIVFGTGLRERAIAWHPDMLVLLALYPVWGLVQQFLVQGLVAGNIVAPALRRDGSETVQPSLALRALVSLFCAVLFGAVHLPNWPLCACTFTMGLAFTPIYPRWRNLGRWPVARLRVALLSVARATALAYASRSRGREPVAGFTGVGSRCSGVEYFRHRAYRAGGLVAFV